MLFVKSESRQAPQAVEKISGGRYLVRRNIETATREDGSAYYTYDEAVATEAEYAAYAAVESAELKRENEIVDEYTLQLIEEGVL